jgi:hypothetical protein
MGIVRVKASAFLILRLSAAGWTFWCPPHCDDADFVCGDFVVVCEFPSGEVTDGYDFLARLSMRFEKPQKQLKLTKNFSFASVAVGFTADCFGFALPSGMHGADKGFPNRGGTAKFV